MTAAGGDGQTRSWNVATGRRLPTTSVGQSSRVNALAYDARGTRLVAASADGAVTVISADGSGGLQRRFAVDPRVRRLAVDPTGRRVAVALPDGSVKLHRVSDGARVGAVLRGSRGPGDVAFSPDGERLAVLGSESEVRLWDMRRRPRMVGTLRGFTENFESIAFSPDGRRLAGASGLGSFELWDTRVPSRRSVVRADPDAAPIHEIAFTRNGNRLVTVGDGGRVRVWSAAESTPSGRALAGHSGDVTQAAIAPDGQLLATGASDGLVRVWDPRTREPLGGPFDEGGGAISDVALDARADVLAVADRAGVTIWQLTPRRVLGLKLSTTRSASAQFTRSGDRLVVLDGATVQSWDSTLWTDDLERLRDHVCTLLRRDLTRAEWQRFVPGQPYRTSCA